MATRTAAKPAATTLPPLEAAGQSPHGGGDLPRGATLEWGWRPHDLPIMAVVHGGGVRSMAKGSGGVARSRPLGTSGVPRRLHLLRATDCSTRIIWKPGRCPRARRLQPCGARRMWVAAASTLRRGGAASPAYIGRARSGTRGSFLGWADLIWVA
jgi:hypothetical protein